MDADQTRPSRLVINWHGILFAGSRFTASGDELRSTSIAAVAAFRRKSCSGDQSLMSATIDEADTDEDEECTINITTDQSSLPFSASIAATAK